MYVNVVIHKTLAHIVCLDAVVCIKVYTLCCQSQGQEISEAMLTDMLKEVDLNKNGRIDESEFLQVCQFYLCLFPLLHFTARYIN